MYTPGPCPDSRDACRQAPPNRALGPWAGRYFVPETVLERLGLGAVARYWAVEARGIHCIAELYGCPSELLNDESLVVDALRRAVERGMATLLHEVSHKFHPQGVTALALIAESHVAIHTWPEVGYAAVDVFTCGDHASAEKACEYLAQALECNKYSLKRLRRGLEKFSEVALQGTTEPANALTPIANA